MTDPHHAHLLRLAEITDEAPEDIPGMPPGKWAVYSVGCGWWTSDVRDSVHAKNGPPLPLCPGCGSVLMQGPLASFIASAVEQADHFGEHGLGALLAGYRNTSCHPSWDAYTPITPED